MIDCHAVISQLSDYLDGEVSPELRRMLESHLTSCHRCSVIYSTTRQTLRIVTECGAFAVPVSAGTRLHSRLKELFAAG